MGEAMLRMGEESTRQSSLGKRGYIGRGHGAKQESAG